MTRDTQSELRFALAEAALADYLANVDGGEPVSFDAWCSERPEFATELRRLHGEYLELQEVLGVDRSAGRGVSVAGPAGLPDDLISRLREPRTSESNYTMQERIGRGGMGDVLSVRDEVLRRELAMKVIREKDPSADANDADDTRRLARFLEEAQVMAQLDHPGVVPVHELGLDAQGRPFFTMKRVRGRTLSEVFELVRENKEGWTVTRALGVLQRVCEAMAYAHEQGVIHRDLKPANVMVGNFGEVYVMDWGLARVLGRADGRIFATEKPKEPDSASGVAADSGSDNELRTERSERRGETPDSSVYTRSGQALGTPQYMPPEQAEGRWDAVGPQSDVYALGAMLYHLLAGRAPYVGRGERPTASELQRRVKAGAPEPLHRLAPQAPAELVAICERAMERDLGGRYADMAQLGLEFGAYIEGRVVKAYETGAVAELRKWVTRNKPLAATLAAAVLLTILGLVLVSVQNQQLLDAKTTIQDKNTALQAATRTAEEKAVQAETSASVTKQMEAAARQSEAMALASEKRAKRLMELVQNALISSDPNQGGTQKYLVTDAMDAAIRELESGALKDDPVTEMSLQTTIAKILNGNGRSEDALRESKVALETAQRLFPSDHPDVAVTLDVLAHCLKSLGRSAGALTNFEAALEMNERLFTGDHPAVASSLNNVAWCLQALGRDAEALQAFETSLGMLQRLHPEDHRDVAMGLNNAAFCLQSLGRNSEALLRFEAALEMNQRLFHGDHPAVATTLANVGGNLLTVGKTAEALTKLEAALEMSQRLFHGDHPDVARGLGSVAYCLMSLGKCAEALPKGEAALEMNQRLFHGDHPDVAAGLNFVALCLYFLGKSAEALPKSETALEMRQRLFHDDHPSVAQSLNQVGLCLQAIGRSAEALPRLNAGLEMYQRFIEGDHADVAASLCNVAGCLLSLGRSAEALPKIEAALEMNRRLFPGDHPSVAKSMDTVAACLMSLHSNADALPKAQAALEMWQRLFPGGHPDVAVCLNRVALCHHLLGELADALPKYEAALEMRQRMFPGDHPDIAVSLNNVGMCLHFLGRSAEALPRCESALGMFQRIYPGDHDSLATSLSCIALCHQSLGNTAVALSSYEAALEMRQRLFHGDHPYVARSLNQVAACLHALGRDVEALPIAERANAMAATVLPEEHEWRKACAITLQDIHAALAQHPGDGPPASKN